ncbi:MAG: M15 family metallopeptidase [Bacilli bacterium]|nr:M15 family metallopeptidase [Bacilli bacterium]
MKLVSEAKSQYEAMAKQAAKEGLKLVATSSYRSYEYQEELYNNYAKRDGKEAADTYSGRPGYSEHQTGLAVDLYNGKELYTEFEKTKEFEWMQKNAHKYGFILRFPKDKEKLTGYEYESWHYRYVGEKIATYIHDNNLCFEEYYTMFIEIFK